MGANFYLCAYVHKIHGICKGISFRITEFSLQFLSVISIKCIYFHRPDLFFFLLFWVYSCTLHHTVGLDLSDTIVRAASSVSAYGKISYTNCTQVPAASNPVCLWLQSKMDKISNLGDTLKVFLTQYSVSDTVYCL